MKLGCMIFAFIVFLFLPGCFSEKFSKKSSFEKPDSQSENQVFCELSEHEIRENVKRLYIPEECCQKNIKKNKKKRRLSRKKKNDEILELARKKEAKLEDIPLPLQVKPIKDFFSDEEGEYSSQVVIGYETDMFTEEIAKFYEQQMDRNGWACLSRTDGREILFNFVKPYRVCSVSVRQRKNSEGSFFVISTCSTGSNSTI